MSEPVDWNEVTCRLAEIYAATDRLQVLFPGRKFTPDGHLVGSIGEVIAAYMFDLDLVRASTRAHDATASDGRKVEVKMTQGNAVALRHEPDHLIVLHRPNGSRVRVVYNGPGSLPWQLAGRLQTNGQRTIRLTALSRLDSEVAEDCRIAVRNLAPV